MLDIIRCCLIEGELKREAKATFSSKHKLQTGAISRLRFSEAAWQSECIRVNVAHQGGAYRKPFECLLIGYIFHMRRAV